MATIHPEIQKRETLNLRIQAPLRRMIDRAAELSGKTRTEFVLTAARVAAEEALVDRTAVTASPQAHAEFLRRLDAPPQPNGRLRHTLETPAPWER